MSVSCSIICLIFFFKQKTAYEMRISDWSSDVCSSDLFIIKILDDGPSVLPYGESIGVVEEEHLPLGNEDEDDYLGLDGDSGGDLSINTTTAKGGLSVLVEPGQDAAALFCLASDTPPPQEHKRHPGGSRNSGGVGKGVAVCVNTGGAMNVE